MSIVNEGGNEVDINLEEMASTALYYSCQMLEVALSSRVQFIPYWYHAINEVFLELPGQSYLCTSDVNYDCNFLFIEEKEVSLVCEKLMQPSGGEQRLPEPEGACVDIESSRVAITTCGSKEGD